MHETLQEIVQILVEAGSSQRVHACLDVVGPNLSISPLNNLCGNIIASNELCVP